MKKFLAIFFISVIGIHFASCTAYAYNYFQAGSYQSQGIAGASTNEFMKFEVLDGFEELEDSFDTDFSHFFSFSPFVFEVIKNGALHGYVTNAHSVTLPIYLTNQVLRI